MVATRKASAMASSSSLEVQPRPPKKAKLSEQDEYISTPAPKGRTKSNFPVTNHENPKRSASAWKIGAHVSAAGGIENSIVNAAAIGANSFALFVKSQRKWSSPPLSPASIASFKARMKEFGYAPDMVLPHGSYLINMGNPDPDKRGKSYECFVDDLKRCEELGLKLYNFHPGSTVGATTIESSISSIAECINRAHKETSHITIVLENMAGAGNIIGSDFAHLASIISEVKDKTRVGVCLDTCHMFAAGYDIRTEEGWNATLNEFNDKVGLSYLRGMHLNDSKAAHNSKKDRHENIGLGHIGLRAFHYILTDPRTQGIPLVLETPSFEKPTIVWAKEIEVLERVSGNGLESTSGDTIDIEGPSGEIRNAVERAAGGSTRVKPTAKRSKKYNGDGENEIEGCSH